jgi:outer membrane receptor for monomeric catechols
MPTPLSGAPVNTKWDNFNDNVTLARTISFSNLFFDKIFDSLNGNFDKIVDGNIYRTSVKRNSPHHQLWVNSLRVLSTMRFEGKNGKDVCVPTIRNWTTTIRGLNF